MLEVKRTESISKKEFIESLLADTLRNADMDIIALELSENENYVTIRFSNNFARHMSIKCDSRAAIIRDVTRAAM